MPTVRDFIVDARVKLHSCRVAALEALPAPEVVITRERELLARAESGNVSDIRAKGDLAAMLGRGVVEVQAHTGQGGKLWYRFIVDSGPAICYWPKARYGAFMSLDDRT